MELFNQVLAGATPAGMEAEAPAAEIAEIEAIAVDDDGTPPVSDPEPVKKPKARGKKA